MISKWQNLAIICCYIYSSSYILLAIELYNIIYSLHTLLVSYKINRVMVAGLMDQELISTLQFSFVPFQLSTNSSPFLPI